MSADRILYDKASAAEKVSVSPKVLDNARRAGDLIARTVSSKPGSKVLFEHDELIAWAKSLPIAKS